MVDNNLAAGSTETLGHRAKELATDAGRTVLESANTTGNRGMNALGSGLDKAASYVESKIADRRVDVVTGPVHHAADYLKEKDPASALQDIDRSIQAHPYRSMAIALGIGWVIGRLMRPSDR